MFMLILSKLKKNRSVNLQSIKNDIEKSIEKYLSPVREELNYLRQDNKHL